MFAKNIVVRLHIFLMIFTLAFAQPVAYASAAPKLDFVEIRNFVRTAGAASADYLFKRAANDPTHSGAANDSHYKTPKHSVSNAKLGKVGFSRILRLSPVSIVGGLVVAELISKLTEQGWIIDPVAQEMYKIDPNPPLMDLSFRAASIDGIICTGSTPQELLGCLNGHHAKFSMTTSLNPNPHPWSPPLNNLSSGEQSASTDFYINTRYGSEHSRSHAYATSLAPAPGDRRIFGTEADVAAILPEISDAGIAELMVSPDYLAEPHAPTAEAALAAKPETTTTAEPQKATLGTKKETVTTTNPDGTTTTTTTTTQTNPDGTPATNPDGTPKTPHVETTTTHPNGTTTTTTNAPKPSETETPAFCDWAKTLCSWLDWTKEPPVSPTDTKVTIKDAPENPTELDTNQRINWSGGCPADPVVNLPMGMPSLELKFFSKFMCPWAEMMRPIFLFSGALISIYIVTGRGMANG